MSGYDPFRYADNYSSEEEYLKDLEEENTIKQKKENNKSVEVCNG